MKILLVAVHFAEYSVNLASALAKSHHVRLIVHGPCFANEMGDWQVPDCDGRLEIIKLRHKASIGVFVENVYRISKLAREFAPDVIHIQEDPKDYLVAALPFLPRAPKVLTIHDPTPHSGADARKMRWSRKGVYEFLLRRCSQGAVVHSERLEQILKGLSNAKHLKSAVAPHGPLGIFSPYATSMSWESGRCLFFGRIEAYKGLGVFLDAIEKLRVEGVKVKAVIAGRGSDLDSHRDRIKGFDDIILVEKFLTPDEVIFEFDRAHLVVLPYVDATQSGVAAYAIGRGRAMVASDVGGLGEMCVDGFSGVLVQPRDVESLADAIKGLVFDSGRSALFATNSLSLGKGRLSWDAAADVAVGLYGQILKGDRLMAS
jgi:alpha-maltose-1-phosphate synthase